MDDAEVAANERETAAALDSILLKDDIWDDCDLGPAKDWPDSLQSLASFVLALTHPAAIYWGSNLIMLYNEAWEVMSGHSPKQGKPPDKTYSNDTITTLRAHIDGRSHRSLASSEFLEKALCDQPYPVMCSPIHEKDKISGVLVQLFCKKRPREDSQDGATPGNKKQGRTLMSRRETDDQQSNQKMAKHPNHDETALDSQPFFQKFAEMLPTGLAILNHKADPVFVNHQFHEMTAHQGKDQSFKMWPETIHPEDYDRVMKEYHEAFESQTNLSTEFRAYGENQWRLFLMRPLGKSNEQQFTLKQFGGFICALVDVSSMKNAEIAQTKAAKEAQERKQQQERFIDMISHEIRNPLSAVVSCAEDILEAVDDGRNDSEDSAFDRIVDAVETIKLCVTHQKNLVDDVLSFSKLDASMLSLAPRATKPRAQMADTLKIFQPELRKLHINFSYDIEPDYEKLDVNWVMADLVRVGQVLVNLMTNAIKFTAKQKCRKRIEIKVSAAVKRPNSYPPDVVFYDTGDTGFKADATGNPEWGDGEPLFIMVAVKDTGIGISKESQARLFQRFRQATPNTEEQYGGSGLGLNIARKLCQLHGGEIGVSSTEGEGSTFGFFFHVRRSGEPDDVDRLEPKEVSRKLQTEGRDEPHDVKDSDVPQDPKGASNSDTGSKNQASTSKERWKQTVGLADEMHDSGAKSDQDRPEPKASSKKDDNKHKEEGQSPKESSKSRGRSPDQGHKRQQSLLHDKDSTDDDGDNKTKNKNKVNSDSRSSNSSGNKNDPKPRVLFVEDNLINQKLLKRKIESKGFEVITAENGKQALDIVQQESSQHQPAFDCILMDNEMPIMDGKAASTEIRKFEKQHDLPPVNIIGVTGSVREEQTRALTDAGMDDVIAKPFDMKELLGKMKRGASRL